MKRKLYHGSDHIIQKPMPKGSKPYNDYGYGFYCTQDADMAKEWAAREPGGGYVNSYTIEDDSLRILQMNSDTYTILHWLTILLENRTFSLSSSLAKEGRDYLLSHFRIPYRNYDVLIGYRADDSYFSFAHDFLNGAISYRRLAWAMQLGHLGEQYVLLSKKAFSALTFTDYALIENEKWFLRRQNRDRLARESYLSAKNAKRQKGDLFITHFLDEEIQANDERLRSHLS